ncbi:LOW QUALITY PROTEIN: tyrosine-protein phosphatase non-receptor type 4 [Anopheles ziemanni]|uniref:LOW QUALITY PROTEIN: tyrosine-protein phosphatase non-receptor type 4 n=1 Tax=Anopheles ziemanni TaxID=345580 RepID=UPI00265D7EE6|nr:LOW QUALITY PROTEIN: tyrosine-protein phosphatase non-receptor type 4 [Anopheles ziemanni]
MLERVRFGGFSGTYKVRGAELARDRKTQTKPVTVLFLDESTHTFHLDKRAKGAELLEQVFQHVELSERDYFGLQFPCPGDRPVREPAAGLGNGTAGSGGGSSNHSGSTKPDHPNGGGSSSGSTGGGHGGTPVVAPFPSGRQPVRWLDPNKSFRKQLQNVRASDGGRGSGRGSTNGQEDGGPIVPLLLFRVKFYVTDPSRLLEEYTRYQFYLQIRRDVYQGRLPVSFNTACLLASFTVQAELGDYNPLEHTAGYLSELQLLPEQTEEAEHRVSELHKLHRGQLPADAEYNYLDHAKRLELYGIDFHRATDSSGKELALGVCSLGLLVYQNGTRINTFSWSKVVKVSFKRKDFFIQLGREQSEHYDTLLGFSMGSHRNAKLLWKACVEHHSFFRLKKPHRSPRSFLPLTLRSKFHYSGRTELQAVTESRQRGKVTKVFIRSPSKRLLTVSQPQSPQLNGTGGDGSGASGGGGSGNETSNGGATVGSQSGQKSQLTLLSITKATRTYDKVTSKTPSIPRKAWEQQSDEPTFIEHCARTSMPMYDAPPAYAGLNGSGGENGTGASGDDGSNGLVTIHLAADEQGRFGFNVKGGIDHGLPIVVSRVAPHTPADKSVPRVCEGDQVVRINGRDVSTMAYEQVVSLIRASREFQGGELFLTLKPNALLDYTEEEPLYQYVPEESDIVRSSGLLNGDQLFTQSLLLLRDGLASGALLTQYEQLYRKNPDLTITEARKPENIGKNRYRDISPYDCTRVVLQNAESGDYINANYVNMEIPPARTTNRYIATQGPLPSTVNDFWRMVQQESSHLVVMLTTVKESGSTKCHQYWPSAEDDPLVPSPGFSITCLTEKPDETGSFVFRDLVMTDERTKETRTIQHMQYLAWPDHDVPADPNLFLQFTERVRSARETTLPLEIEASLKNVKLRSVDENGGLDNSERRIVHTDSDDSPNDMPSSTSVHQYISASNPPIIVHCSAGIGRTGVLILMDTALALMEVREPIYPLDIVQAMRDQRPCMVQNVSQYRFVCECICAAYLQQAAKEVAAAAVTEASSPVSGVGSKGGTAGTKEKTTITSPTAGITSPVPKSVPSIASPEETLLDTPAEGEKRAPLATETTSGSTVTTGSPVNGKPAND